MSKSAMTLGGCVAIAAEVFARHILHSDAQANTAMIMAVVLFVGASIVAAIDRNGKGKSPGDGPGNGGTK